MPRNEASIRSAVRAAAVVTNSAAILVRSSWNGSCSRVLRTGTAAPAVPGQQELPPPAPAPPQQDRHVNRQNQSNDVSGQAHPCEACPHDTVERSHTHREIMVFTHHIFTERNAAALPACSPRAACSCVVIYCVILPIF